MQGDHGALIDNRAGGCGGLWFSFKFSDVFTSLRFMLNFLQNTNSFVQDNNMCVTALERSTTRLPPTHLIHLTSISFRRGMFDLCLTFD